MRTKTVITPEVLEAVKQRFFNNKNNTVIAIATDLNLKYATAAKAIGIILDERMNRKKQLSNNNL